MYRWVDHTAEVELEIEAPSETEVLADAIRALAELLGITAVAAEQTRIITVSAADRPALLAAWLEELVFLAESEGFVATSIDAIDLSDGAVTATVAGVATEPPPLVKAVTYHRLAFGPAPAGYVARVVLDV